jgi:tetratricopeptide (TPR) repeat protein
MKIGIKIFLIIFFSLAHYRCSPVPPSHPYADSEPPAFLFYKRALFYVENDEFEKALSQLDTAIAMKPEFAQFYYAQGQVFELMENYISALVSYEKAIRYQSHYPDTWKKLVHLYMRVGQYDKASQMLRNLTDDQPDSLQYELALAESYIFDQKPLLALERLSYYEKQGGKSLDKIRLQGMAYFVQDNFEKAIDLLDKYVAAIPQNYLALKYLGIACIKVGKSEKGVSALNRALQLNPEDPEIYLFRAQYFLQMNKVEAAAEQYQHALLIDESNTLVLLENSKFLLSRGDTLTAEKLLQKALAIKENCWECYKFLGIIADEQGRDLEALQYLQKYLSNIYHPDLEVEKRLKNLRAVEQKNK